MENEIPIRDDTFWRKKGLKTYIYLAWQVLWGLPKSVIFNFKYFGIKGIRLPVILSYKVKLSKLSGKVRIKSKMKFGMIKLGFTAAETYDNSKLSFVWINDGIVEFAGKAGIHNGVSLRVYGKLVLGSNFNIPSTAKIICYKNIEFGDDVLIGWDFEAVDGDAHKIYNANEGEHKRLNEDKAIKVGNRVWFGSNVKVLKGAKIGNDCVVAAGTIVTKIFEENNCVIGKNPVSILKKNIIWRV